MRLVRAFHLNEVVAFAAAGVGFHRFGQFSSQVPDDGVGLEVFIVEPDMSGQSSGS